MHLIGEIHLGEAMMKTSGEAGRKILLIDTHGAPVVDPAMWALVSAGSPPTTGPSLHPAIEWDTDVPEMGQALSPMLHTGPGTDMTPARAVA